MNTAADFSSQLEMDPNEKIIFTIREDFPTKPIEVNIESTGIAQEKPVFSDTTDQEETTEKELWKRKEQVRNAIPNDHQSSQCRVIMQMTNTRTQQL